jgi:hypothetical protein
MAFSEESTGRSPKGTLLLDSRAEAKNRYVQSPRSDDSKEGLTKVSPFYARRECSIRDRASDRFTRRKLHLAAAPPDLGL